MSKKIKIWSSNTEGTTPKKVSPMNVKGEESLADLRIRLESKEVVPWSFHFWDLDEDCQIGVKFESLNMIPEDVYLIPTTEEDEEPSKRRQLGDGYHVFVLGEENTL